MPPKINHIACMDALEYLKQCEDESVNCIITSPPYYGLRDYGMDGQIGLEETLQEFIAKLVEIFRETRRVLRSDGTMWVNMGDSYAATTKGNNNGTGKSTLKDGAGGCDYDKRVNHTSRKMNLSGLKPKDLIGQPWRLAFALQDDGWYLRSDIIWHKPNPMPESVTDRPTKAHEYIFLLTKSARYWYNAEAIREANSPGSIERFGITEAGQTRKWDTTNNKRDNRTDGTKSNEAFRDHVPVGRNKRTVWTVATQPMALAHFATFPPKLIEPMILAGCPKGGVVLDMFMGAGTTALVAQQHNRNYMGCELNPDYLEIANARLQGRVREFIADKKGLPVTQFMFED